MVTSPFGMSCGSLKCGSNRSELDVSASLNSYVLSLVHRTALSVLLPRTTSLEKIYCHISLYYERLKHTKSETNFSICSHF